MLVVGEGKKHQQHCYIGPFFFLHHELKVAKNIYIVAIEATILQAYI
jgi:hypothetical protein